MPACVSACASSSVNQATLGALVAQVGVKTAVSVGASRLNAYKAKFTPVAVFAKDVILIVPANGVAQLGQKNVSYTVSNLSDYVTGVVLQASWPALIACDASTPAGQQAVQAKQYAVLPPSKLVRNCAEQAFFEKYADLRVETLCGALVSGIRNYLISTAASYNTPNLDSVCEDISKRQAHAWFVDLRNVAMIDCADVRFNNIKVDGLTKESIYILDEMYSTSGARLKSIAGGYDTVDELIIASQQAQCFYTPLLFFFNRKKNDTTAGHSLATASMLYTPVTINISFMPIDLLIIVSKPGLVVKNFSTGQPPRDSDVQINMIAEIIQVEIPLRDALALAAYTVTYRYVSTLVYTNAYQTIQLDIKNACKNFSVALRTEAAAQIGHYFDFSGLAGQPAILNVTLKFNSIDRLNAISSGLSVALEQQSGWYNVRRIEENFIWFWSFTSENLNPHYRGADSFDAYQTISLRLALQEGLEMFAYQVFIVYESFNLIRFVDSVGAGVYTLT